ncbi:MAG: hypothetical protein RIQ56_60, partial [Candidatus Parcubacteria bacterium]
MRESVQRKSVLRFERDLVLIVAAIFVTVALVNSGILDFFLSKVQEQYMLASFIVGIFFTSAFTIAPAAIILAHIGA